MYIPPNATIFVGNNLPVSSFGTVLNDGNLSIHKNGQFYFIGKIFRNNQKALITDESTINNSRNGGTVIFHQPNAAYGNLGMQLIESGFTDSLNSGPQFSNITLNNSAGIYLTSDMSVINSVKFNKGRVYLNLYVASLGDSIKPALIDGYDDTRFFVTGTSSTGGSLKMNSLTSCCITSFPIGVSDNNYAPLQLRNLSAKTDVYARAFENVYSNGPNGSVMTDSILRLTWAVHSTNPSASEVEAVFQHDQKVETNSFNSSRNASYVSLLTNGKWDNPRLASTPKTPGTITSTFSISSAMMNSRKINLSNKPLYITKKTRTGKKLPIRVPNAFSPNGDGINDVWVLEFLETYANCRVEIFDRYGTKLFSSIGYNRPWDGTFKGSPVPVATYYYIIDKRDGEAPLSGYVVVLR
jgi:gliding motility-associated-like protein